MASTGVCGVLLMSDMLLLVGWRRWLRRDQRGLVRLRRRPPAAHRLVRPQPHRRGARRPVRRVRFLPVREVVVAPDPAPGSPGPNVRRGMLPCNGSHRKFPGLGVARGAGVDQRSKGSGSATRRPGRRRSGASCRRPAGRCRRGGGRCTRGRRCRCPRTTGRACSGFRGWRDRTSRPRTGGRRRSPRWW